jgi:hypothetical protein
MPRGWLGRVLADRSRRAAAQVPGALAAMMRKRKFDIAALEAAFNFK